MNIETTIRERRSIRAFKPDPIPEGAVRDLLDVARWAPSWANTQSISAFVVSGRALDAIKDGYRSRSESQAPRNFDLAVQGEWPPHWASRTRRLREARAEREAEGTASRPASGPFEFFGAPVLVFLAVEEKLQPEYAAFDAGILTQTFCLAAHNRGFGTCIMAQAVAYPDVLRQVIARAAGHKFIVGIALGYADGDASINRFERERAPIDERVLWLSNP